MLKIILPFVLLLSTISSLAQNANFRGTVRTRNGKPVARATVILLNTNLNAVTADDGSFDMKKPDKGNYELYVTAIGYASITKIILIDSEDLSIDLEMREAASELDEVVVSARKLEERLQSLPFSVSALSEKQVRAYRLWDARELTAVIPNLYSSDPGDLRNVTSVRGITSTSYDPAIVTYIDGVNQFNLDTYISTLFDVERIEVLRGPQGTLYGRNAMGGVIQVLTRQPKNKFSLNSELSVGDYGLFRGSVGASGPVVKDKLYIGLAGLVDRRDGYYENTVYSNDYDQVRLYAGNFFMKYLQGTRFDVNLNVKYRANTNYGTFPLVFGKEQALEEPFVLSQNATAAMKDKTLNGSITMNYRFSKINLQSITAYQDNHRYYNDPLDGDFSPLDAVAIFNDYGDGWNRVKVLTQELRLHSTNLSRSALSWTAGAYFFQVRNPVKQATQYGTDAPLIGVPDSLFSVVNTTKGKNRGGAFYGQVQYRFGNKWRLTGGLRFDLERKEQSVLSEYQPFGSLEPVFAITPDTAATANFSALSPMATLRYDLASSSMLYFTYSRGFRAGGLTGLSSDPSQPPLYGYDPEYSSNWEFGIKNQFWDKKILLNLALFYIKVNDAQVPTLVLPEAVTITRNAGELSSRGIEVEIAANPFKGLRLDYNFGYTKARYERLKLSSGGMEVNLEGSRQIFTPRYTSMLALQYQLPLNFWLKPSLVVRGEWHAIGRQYFDLGNTLSQGDYQLLHARVGLMWKETGLYFWARNLTDKKYVSYGYDFGAVHLGNPRTFGGSLVVRI